MMMHMAHDTKLAAVDLNLLVALKALLNERHVTRAARQLGLSQSATSHALSRLRDLYGRTRCQGRPALPSDPMASNTVCAGNS
jgi:DNA-binding transcriptional ArsR family regulator